VKKNLPSTYRPGKMGLEKVLGSLESEVMEIIWRKREELCVRDVLELLSARRDIAYTTVMTIMGRLAQKKLLSKRKEGNTFYFKPFLTREEFAGQVVSGVVDDLLADFSEETLAHFLHRVREQDLETLQKLEKMLAKAKEEGNHNDR